jgi:AAA+ superfamily predicted ATPase
LEDADGLVECDNNESQGRPVRQAVLRELSKHEGLVIIVATTEGKTDSNFNQHMTHEINFSRPTVQERKQLFELMLCKVPIADEVDTMTLALNYDLTGAQIKNLVIKALTKASRENRKVNQTDLTRAAFNGPSMTHQWIADATKGMVQ